MVTWMESGGQLAGLCRAHGAPSEPAHRLGVPFPLRTDTDEGHPLRTLSEPGVRNDHVADASAHVRARSAHRFP